MTEYPTRFTQLSLYAPNLVSIKTMRVWRFEHELRPAMRSRLLAMRLPMMAVVVERATLLERDLADIRGNGNSD